MVTICPAGLFGDYSTKQCVNDCPTGQYGNPINSKCVSICPDTYYTDASISKKCALQCPAEETKQIQLPLSEIEEKQKNEKSTDVQKKLDNNTTPEQPTINFLTAVMSYHEFFSIFSLNEPSISRPVRFTIYYIKTIYLMTTTIVFSQTLNPIQTIALSAISGLAYSIIASLIKLLLTINIVLKVIGVLVSIGICFVCWYSTLVVNASKSPEESNYWSLQYFGALFSDIIIVQLLVGATKYVILLELIKRKDDFIGFVKKINEILIKVLMNQKLNSVFSSSDQL